MTVRRQVCFGNLATVARHPNLVFILGADADLVVSADPGADACTSRPVTSNPQVTDAVPAVITADPHVSPARSTNFDSDARARRNLDPNNDARARPDDHDFGSDDYDFGSDDDDFGARLDDHDSGADDHFRARPDDQDSGPDDHSRARLHNHEVFAFYDGTASANSDRATRR